MGYDSTELSGKKPEMGLHATLGLRVDDDRSIEKQVADPPSTMAALSLTSREHQRAPGVRATPAPNRKQGMSDAVHFDKYDADGAYHWAECDRRYANWKRYNPALDARYEVTKRKIQSLGLRGSLLDVGCGDGMLMARVAPLFERIIGVDSEMGAIRLAKEKLSALRNCEALHISSYDLPFAAQTFDVVASADVIEHLKDPARHLQEIGRVLTPGGAVVLTTPKWRPDGKWDQRHEREYRAEELRALLAEHFRHVEMNYFWPMKWSPFYATRAGWRTLKVMAIQLHNPFLQSSAEQPEKFGQLLAVCRNSRDQRP